MHCKVYELKVDKSRLSDTNIKYLDTLFKEAKWFYNYCLSQENIKDADATVKSVQVKVKDNYEERIFTVLPGAVKAAIKEKIFISLRGLSTTKKKGKKVGRLKFKKVIDSIPLRQFNHSYYIKDNKIRISGMKSWLKVDGVDQIPQNAERANANLIRRNGDFYLNITTFIPKEAIVYEKIASVGIDFGCETPLTLSNGLKIKFEVPISAKLKRLDRKIMKNDRPKSNNRYKDEVKRRKEYEKLTAKKDEIRRQIVHIITTAYKYVCFQDESIHAWAASNHGKKIQNTAIGKILANLKTSATVPLLVWKFFPSTQLCPECGNKQKLPVSVRIYDCPTCGHVEDRDIKSAICIEEEGLKDVETDDIIQKRGIWDELDESVYQALNKIPGVTAIKPDFAK